jgi:quercetin dioxygenase-like cupin family protein
MMEQTAYATAPPVLYELSGVEKSCEGPAERITILKNMDLTVRAGESFYFQAGKKHRLENNGNRDAILIWVSTPPSF